MSVCDCIIQQVKKNKEDSVALANHAREMMFKLANAVQVRIDQDSLKPSIEDNYRLMPLSQTQKKRI
jgi:poly-gamma-glutamate capsule biosynthesis protein CapA/YwtB (metallophosphatase superfamily)